MCAADSRDSALERAARTSDGARATAAGAPARRGHCDVPMPAFDGVDAIALRRELDLPGLHLFESVGSTLDVAHELGEGGAPHGTLVIANEQTEGRGRGGKSWASPPHSGLWMTILARPAGAVVPQVLTVRLGLAAARALDPLAGSPIRIKWPNDLLLGDRKLAGVLVEARWRGSRAEWLAVGLGINVNAPGHADRGGALGPHVQRLDVLRALMPPLREAIDRRDVVLGATERSEFDARDRAQGAACLEPRPGIVRGITGDAELLIETVQGVVAVNSGSLVLAEDS